jgi:hypothetical protein
MIREVTTPGETMRADRGRRTRSLRVHLAACLAVTLAASGTAAADLIDQSYLPTTGQGFNLEASENLPLGQEFQPTLGSLNFVDLWIGDAGTNASIGANVQVNIRAGTITGAILGTSTAHVPDNLNLGGGTALTRFLFASPVTLTPGSTYVIDASQIAPIVITPPADNNINFLWYGGPLNASTYPNGRAIVSGTPQPNFDFGFQEGLTSAAVPEPSFLALAAFGAGVVGLTARLRRRAAGS